MKLSHLISGIALSLGGLVAAAPAHAIVASLNTNANALGAAAAAGSNGFTINSVTLSGNQSSTGTFTNASNTYGIGGGIVLSTGNVLDYGDGASTSSGKSTEYGQSATAAQTATLSQIGGAANYYDVTELTINFTTTTGSVFFNTVFGSEEFPEFVGSYVDAFGLLIDGVNIAFVGGKPVNIDHPSMKAIAGTELDGILCPGAANQCSPVQTFSLSGLDTSIAHSLKFIIGDRGDSRLDTTVYISALGGTPPADVPLPGTLALFGLGLLGLARVRRQRA
ncbi:choice-of-anchor L domain-containing protein [Massilia sp. SR12]